MMKDVLQCPYHKQSHLKKKWNWINMNQLSYKFLSTWNLMKQKFIARSISYRLTSTVSGMKQWLLCLLYGISIYR